MSVKFWADDISVLYNKEDLLKVLPKYDMTENEVLNSITRLGLWLLPLFLIFCKEIEWLYIPAVLIIGSLIIYYLKDKSKSSDDFSQKYGPNNPYNNKLLTDIEQTDVREDTPEEKQNKDYMTNRMFQHADEWNTSRMFYTVPEYDLNRTDLAAPCKGDNYCTNEQQLNSRRLY